jgi:hypothetical protein
VTWEALTINRVMFVTQEAFKNAPYDYKNNHIEDIMLKK